MLIRPALPPRRVYLEVKGFGEPSRIRRITVNPKEDVIRERVATFLRQLTGREVTWLRTARRFVAELTPEELRQVLTHPQVKEVHANFEVQVRDTCQSTLRRDR